MPWRSSLKAKKLFLFTVFLFFSFSIFAQEKVYLWPKKKGPGSEKLKIQENVEERGAPSSHDRAISAVTEPYFEVYKPETPNKKGILIIPGGSYQRVVYDKEGLNYTKAYNDAGYTCFVLVYRTPNDDHKSKETVSLQDAQRAMRIIKSRSSEFNLDEAKIGVIGSSAGGHVAASLALFYDREVYKPVDKADFSSEKEKTWRSAKPAFQILMYPVISMQDERTHSLSQKNLLGENASSQLKDEWSLENHVTKTAPISFLCCAINDKSVNPEGNIIPYWQALRKNGVKTELHVFPASGHGFGVNGASGTARQWQALSITWLETYVK